MPQPLSRVKPDAEIAVGPQALTIFPQFNAQIVRVIAQWAHIDGDLANIFANLMRSDVEIGTAIYQAFHSLQTRQVALFKAAEFLPEWQRMILRAIWRGTEPSRNQRDRFAHHVWGHSRDIPDALLLMDSRVVVDRNVSWRQRTAIPNDPGRFLVAPKDFDRDKVFVYRKPDFDRAVKDADAASWLVGLAHFAIGRGANEQGRRQLLNEPLFQQWVEPLTREKSPEVQAQLRPPGNDPPAPGLWDHLPVG
jgi:hypothetical protein